MKQVTGTALTRYDLENWMLRFGELIVAQHEALSDLDASSGDADHGSNMERGFVSIGSVMSEWSPDLGPGAFLKEVGLHVVNSVGGSSGALYGTIFLRMARIVGDSETIDDRLLVLALAEAEHGLIERGKVQPGDKTMLDALAPAVATLRAGVDDGQPLPKVLEAASAAANAGRDATKDMAARRGKSSYARERSRGVVDPGAASMALLIGAAADVFVHESRLAQSAVD